ncbi:MAG: hypothetical protein ACE148_12190 [Vicinamibacterales bacterium]
MAVFTAFRCRSVPALLASLLAFVAVSAAAGQAALSKLDGERFEKKLALIVRQAEIRPGAVRRTAITENEVNAYFAHQGRDLVPAGIVEPHVTIVGDGRLAGRAIVDLDAVRKKQSSGGWFDLTSYLTGRLPIAATGVLRTRNGVAWLDVQAVQVAGVTVPKQLLQQLVTHYSRTPDMPEGLNLDDPFSLPAGIREILVRRGEAVIVQ